MLLPPQVFGRVVDPERFASEVYSVMNGWQADMTDTSIGVLKLFSPANPTGRYSLLLGHQVSHE